ncbi:MAG: hypothetical protein JWL69_29 [Phycisphaerales bacterium]|nr:hypothetical protein [Phycisphaerales bacterium]
MPDVEGKNDRRFAIALTTLYAAWVVFVAMHHEPWRDEADAWLAARDMGLRQLFHWLGPAGWPGLWYLLLMPLAKAGLPVTAMKLLHAALAIGVVGLIAFFAPFSRLMKVLIAFSYFIIYEYAAVSRGYVLTVLLLLLIAMVLSARERRYVLLGVLLFLLFNATTHGFLFAGAISAVVAVQAIARREFSRPMVAGAIIAGIGGLLAFITLLPAAHGAPQGHMRRWPVIQYVLCEAFFPRVPHYYPAYFRETHGNHLLAYAAYYGLRTAGFVIVLAACALLAIRRRWDALAIVLLGWGAVNYIGVFKWFGDDRHAGLLFVLVVFGLWIAGPRGQAKWAGWESVDAAAYRFSHGILAASLLVACAVGVLWSYHDIRWDYSGSTEAAAYIRDHGLTKIPIVASGATLSESILPELPGTRFWYASRHDYGTYVDWGGNWRADDKIPQREIRRRADQQFPSQQYLLVIHEAPLKGSAAEGYRLVFENTHHVFEHVEERYYLYLRDDFTNGASQRP